MKIGKLTAFTQNFLRECKKNFNRIADTEVGTWELFILEICESFCDHYKEQISKALQLRKDFYGEWPYNPDFFKISESAFQEYKKEAEKHD